MLNNKEPQTVSELTRNIKLLIQENFPFVYVTGEISNLSVKQPRNHCYFTLKDDFASISAVIWGSKYEYLPSKPENGMKVLIKGKVVVYEPRGTYQIDVSEIIPTGLGELQAAFEKLKKKLAAEGLFDDSRKKQLPKFPVKVGIITSPTGAVIKDFKTVAARRFPLAEIYLFPATMQGEASPRSVISQLRKANRKEYELQVIVIARGGGSLEDLMPFNDESLAREIASSGIPVVSAIGHETDYTICDFVSDLRAPTPSAAAENIFPDMGELLETLNRFKYNAWIAVKNYVDERKNKLKHFTASYAFNKPVDVLRDNKLQLDAMLKSAYMSVRRTINYCIETVLHKEKLLYTYRPSRQLNERYKYLDEMLKNISKAAMYKKEKYANLLDSKYISLMKLNPLENISEKKEMVNASLKYAKSSLSVYLERIKSKLENNEKLLKNISPEQTLKRGYAYVIRNSEVISRREQLNEEDIVELNFNDGKTNAIIRNNIKPTLFED
ncbi:MAG TPA: exodeoxyribonuclease VII large subunit [Ignavibacteria bacterium]|nr:exodeoxyribonuclease VII large subunit [Ignavibacteria bacterium]